MTTPRTVLVVDDEPQLLRLVSRVLTRAGLQTLVAADADEAMRVFRGASEIDLVLLDVILPDGQGAAELMPRMLAERPDLEVVVTSGDQLPESLEQALAAAGGRYLRKPFVPRTLLRTLGVAEVGSAGSAGPTTSEAG